jgi:hypothetical protein
VAAGGAFSVDLVEKEDTICVWIVVQSNAGPSVDGQRLNATDSIMVIQYKARKMEMCVRYGDGESSIIVERLDFAVLSC